MSSARHFLSCARCRGRRRMQPFTGTVDYAILRARENFSAARMRRKPSACAPDFPVSLRTAKGMMK